MRKIIFMMLIFLMFSIDVSAQGTGVGSANGIMPVFDEETGDLISFDYEVKSTEGSTGRRYKTDRIIFDMGNGVKAIFNRDEIENNISPVLEGAQDGIASIPVEDVAEKMGVSADSIRSEIVNGDDFGVRAHIGIYDLGPNGWEDANKIENIPYWTEAARDRLRDLGFSEQHLDDMATRFRMGDVDVPTDPGDPDIDPGSGHYMEMEASFVHPENINNPENDPALSGSRIVHELTHKTGYGIPIVAEVGDFKYDSTSWSDSAGSGCGDCGNCEETSYIQNFEVNSIKVYVKPSWGMDKYWKKPEQIEEFDRIYLGRVNEESLDDLYDDDGDCTADNPHDLVRFVLPRSAFPQELRNFHTVPNQEDGTYTLDVILDIDATYDEWWCDKVKCESSGRCCDDHCTDSDGDSYCCDYNTDYYCDKECDFRERSVPNNEVELELEIDGSMFDDDETNITY